jgi:hypothetical protein
MKGFGFVYALAAIVMIAALSACNPYLQAQSAAPPGRTARMDEVNGFWKLQYYRLELSQGVAFALTCNQGGPCEHAKIVSEDPAIAEARPASLAVLEKSGLYGSQTSTAMVIVGKAPGKTWLHLTSEQGHRDVLVTIVPPPGPPNAQTAAK